MDSRKKSPFFIELETVKDCSPRGVESAKDCTKSLLTKRSRFFTAEVSPNQLGIAVTSKAVEPCKKDIVDFEGILRRFMASRSKQSPHTLSFNAATNAPTPVTADGKMAGEEGRSCPICLCAVPDDELAGPNSCQHSCFCFSCLAEWGRVVNKCPLCKSTFTEVVSTNSERKETFNSCSKVTCHPESDAEEDSAEEEYAEEEMNQVCLYGYDDSDGFVVREDFVEYDSASEGDFLDL